MSRLDFFLNQPFEDAENRGFRLLLLAGVILLALVAIIGRTPFLAAAVVAYLLSLPAYAVVRNRTWNESLANVDVTAGRDETSVARVDSERNDDSDESS